MKKLILLFCAALALSSCTENMKVKSFGVMEGTYIIIEK